MGLELLPEIKMARKVLQKHSLEVPFDIDNLVEKYAKIVYKHIPVDGVDGICLHLKTAGKTPTVIVNADSFRTRQKFTLAHELGHIIIPWHCGTFIDEIDENKIGSNTKYWELEKEANRFASELLMPFDWIFSLYKKNPDPEFLHSEICGYCGVSDIAASIRVRNAISEIEHLLIPTEWVLQLYNDYKDLARVQSEIVKGTRLSPKRVAEHMVQHLPGKVAFCIETNDIVIVCGSTRTTHSFHQWEGAEFIKAPYQYFQSYSVSRLYNVNTHWWVLDNSFDIPDDSRSWREILGQIASEISPSHGVERFKTTVNAQLSGAYGNWPRRNPGKGVEKFIEDSIQRFNNPDYIDFIQHPDFLSFIKKRSEALFSK